MGGWPDGTPGVVVLPDGTRLRGTGLRRPRDPSLATPEHAVHLLAAPEPAPWPTTWVHWPDFRTPKSTDEAVAALLEAHQRATGQRVEVACGGGVGRTGTALALLAVVGGVPPAQAVSWVRRHYHPRAVETPWQRRWVRRAAALATRGLGD